MIDVSGPCERCCGNGKTPSPTPQAAWACFDCEAWICDDCHCDECGDCTGCCDGSCAKEDAPAP